MNNNPWKDQRLKNYLNILASDNRRGKIRVASLITIPERVNFKNDKINTGPNSLYDKILKYGGNLEDVLNDVKENTNADFDPTKFVLSFFVGRVFDVNVFPPQFADWISTMAKGIDFEPMDRRRSERNPNTNTRQGSILPFTMEMNWYNASLKYAIRNPTIYQVTNSLDYMTSLDILIKMPHIIQEPLINYLSGAENMQYKDILKLHYDALVDIVNVALTPSEQQKVLSGVEFSEYENRLYPDRSTPNMALYAKKISNFATKIRESKTIIAWNGRDRFEKRERSSSRTRGRERDRGDSEGFTN